MMALWVLILCITYCVRDYKYAIRNTFYVFCVLLFLVGCSRVQTAVSPQPTVNPQPVPSQAVEVLAVLQNAPIPERDPVLLTAQLRGTDAPRTVTATKSYKVGDIESFYYSELTSNETEQIEAELLYHSDELSMWVEVGQRVNRQALAADALRIESEILPTTRAVFGEEWRPGVDGDPRVHILHVGDLGGVAAAYFAVKDEFVTAVNPYSNQREMLYVNLSAMRPGTDAYLGTIAHEMQHLIQWHTDRNEDSWLGEGLSELASELNGFPANRQRTYAQRPDIQLTTVSHEPEVVSNHYAATTLFTHYLYERFGQAFMEAVVQHPENGLQGIDAVLAEFEHDLTVEGVFADWLVANYLTSIGRGEDVYRYEQLSMPELVQVEHSRFPQTETTVVNQFGADFIKISSDQPITVVFTGTQQIPLVKTTPPSGEYFYASIAADASYVQMTKAFDLRDVDTATLTFKTWYAIEEGWDYGYVMVSTDNGRSWTLLATESTTLDNPFGNSFGAGYTGHSGGGIAPAWIEETADLTSFAGNEILLRFATITDGAVTEAGFFVDDIAIPEINFWDDAEAENGWVQEGFMRSTAVLPQKFLVQRILLSDGDVQVEQLSLNEAQQGQWIFPMDKQVDEAILIVAGVTPFTREAASYQYSVFSNQ